MLVINFRDELEDYDQRAKRWMWKLDNISLTLQWQLCSLLEKHYLRFLSDVDKFELIRKLDQLGRLELVLYTILIFVGCFTPILELTNNVEISLNVTLIFGLQFQPICPI